MATHIVAESDHHLPPLAYLALAVLAGVIGLCSSYVTVQFFIVAIQATERMDSTRELLTLAAILFVVCELAAFFIAGLLPVRRLRALRWRLSACAMALVAFEAVSIYGSQVAIVRAADAVTGADAGRIEQLRASITANRRTAEALLANGVRNGQSTIASSRADGTQALRFAAQVEARNAALSAELARIEAARVPTATDVFGESGMIALSVARALLISVVGLLFLGAAGALARAARDARSALTASTAALTDASTTTHPTASTASTDAPAAPVRAPSFGQSAPAALPRGAVAAVPTGRRWAAAAGLGGAAAMAAPAFAAVSVPNVTAPSQSPAAIVTAESHPTVTTESQSKRAAPRKRVTVDVGSKLDSGVGEHDGHRYRRIRDAVAAGDLKPSVRALQAQEGGGTAIVRAYLQQLERDGVIERQGRGYRLIAA